MISTPRKEQTQLLKGFDIRIQRDGSSWMNEQAHCWAVDGQMPVEWIAIVKDPTVVKAVMFPSTQRTWRADRRRNVATYDRAMVEALAAL